MKELGIVLLVLGILALAYQGFTYVTHDKVIDIGPIEVTKEHHKTVYIQPVLGAVAVAIGIALLLTKARSS